MLKRIDHIGVIVDNLGDAQAFLDSMGLELDRDVNMPGRLRGAFYRCGDAHIEVIEIDEPNERAQRLGSDKARVEHIAIEVDNLQRTLEALSGLGVKPQQADPIKVGANLNAWTIAETSDGVVYQLIEKGSV